VLVGSAGNGATTVAVTTTLCNFIGVGTATTTAVTCTNAAATQVPLPVAGSVKTFFVNTPGFASGHNDKLTYTVRKNGTATAATCAPATVSATTCSITGLSIAFSAGDLIDVQIAANAGSPPTTPTAVNWAVQYQ
jgi:hypothetical protein